MSREYIHGPFQEQGDTPEPLHESAGALARAIVKGKKVTHEKSLNEINEDDAGLVCTPRCAAPAQTCTYERGANPQVKQQVQNIHENMGHCNNENLVVELKYGKARQAFIEAAQHLVCPTCEANRRPRWAKKTQGPGDVPVQRRHRDGYILRAWP